MPATAPPVGDAVAARLLAIGQVIRAHRKRLRVSAAAAAESAGMSRVTLHRIERGVPSVAVGAYMSVVAALGLEFQIVDAQDRRGGEFDQGQTHALPSTIRPADYPQLERLAWQHAAVTELTPKEALDLYERNWRHVDQSALDARERTLVNALARAMGGRRLLVRA